MTAAFIIYLGVLFCTVTLAMAFGGISEKMGAFVILSMVAIQFVTRWLVAKQYTQVDAAFLISDIFGLIGFGIIALGTNRFWPIWATSLQLLCCSAQFAKYLQPQVEGLVYALMTTVPSGLVVIGLLYASVRQVSRKRMTQGQYYPNSRK